MADMKCPSCGSGLDFKSVLTSNNPARIKCPGCDTKAVVPLSFVIPIAITVLGLSIALWYYVELQDVRFKPALIAFIALGLGVELLYFLGLKKGIVPSTLVSEFKKEVSGEGAATERYKVLPRIKNTNFVSASENLTSDATRSMPITEPLVGDLVLAYAVDIGDRYVALSEATASEFNIDLKTVRQTSEFNALPALRGIRMNPHGKLVELICSDNMMACSLLFPALWNQIEGQAGGPVVVAVPHRDTVIYARADDAEAIEELKSAMAQFDFEDTHALSKQLFVRANEGWEVFGG